MKLVIQTSSGFAQLCLLDGAHIHARLPVVGQSGPRIQDRDLATLTRELLAEAAISIADLSGLAVDLGPGRLAATRMAVAFVNALAFARQLPLQAVPAFSLLGAEAYAQGQPHALVLRRASGARYYWGLMRGAQVVEQGLSTVKQLPLLHQSVVKQHLDGIMYALVSDQALPAPLASIFTEQPNLVADHASPSTLATLLADWPCWRPGALPYPVPLTESAFNASLE